MANFSARVALTDKAQTLITQLSKEHGELIFHQSGGCCDGSALLCMSKSEFYLGSNDLHIGTIGGCGFFMHSDNFEYFKGTHITVDVEEGRGASFSLEAGSNQRFSTIHRLFTPQEEATLFPVET